MFKSKILLTEFVTHDVKRFVIEKPKKYKFTPGQATDVAINLPDWSDKKHPFTFTSLNDDLVLEFTIKVYNTRLYPNHTGMTEKLHTLKPGNELLIDKPWGTIQYKGTGVFIAGGAGITPFIAIFRDLKSKGKMKGNKLIYSNKLQKDIIIEKELRDVFADDGLFLTLTREKIRGYCSGRVDESFIKKSVDDFSQNFYLCGPDKMVEAATSVLKDLGAKTNSIVFEE